MEMTLKKPLHWSWNSPTHSSSTSQPSKHRRAEHHEDGPARSEPGSRRGLGCGPGVNVLVTAARHTETLISSSELCEDSDKSLEQRAVFKGAYHG